MQALEQRLPFLNLPAMVIPCRCRTRMFRHTSDSGGRSLVPRDVCVEPEHCLFHLGDGESLLAPVGCDLVDDVEEVIGRLTGGLMPVDDRVILWRVMLEPAV